MSPILHGDPTWIDLSTHDLEGSRTFYKELFGWEFNSQGEEYGGYNIILSEGEPVGGAMDSHMGPEGRSETPMAPTAWTIYLKVDDMDVALAAALETGGQILLPSMQVGSLGFMAIVSDPAGGVVGLWQALDFPGITREAVNGQPAWFEVMTKDFDAAAPFYEKVTGWKLSYIGEDGQPTDGPGDGIRYAANAPGEAATAGMCEANSFLPEEIPSHWRTYFTVADVDATVSKLQELGGQLLDGPVDTPFGRIATVADPQGATFQLSNR
ncbi:VOC family protein [Corynebacterium ulcerans]|uniref:VOC family protein n=1 Tax=Corynebacterium ulcerans TaxID=65058 RepID=UPI0005FEAEC3|nr:VOC family protein [Corynebacterium ulcerans]AKA95728.1 Glyoxalase/Bleomycin resistance protein/Dihydroxybiphenyl dioxygenase [Corynebacterium ulcerans]